MRRPHYPLALGLILGLAGLSAAVAGSGLAARSSGPLKTIEFVNPLPSYPSWAIANQCFNKAVKQVGAQGKIVGPPGQTADPQANVNEINQAVADKVSAIIALPLDPHTFTVALSNARKHGILVATLNTGNTTTVQNIEFGTGYPALGSSTVYGASKAWPTANLGVILGESTPPGSLLLSGIKTSLPHYKNVTLTDVEVDNDDATKDADIASAMLTAHPEINVLYAMDGTAAPGLITAVKEHNLQGKVKVIVNDLGPSTRASIMAGDIWGTNLQNFCKMVTRAVTSLVKIKQGHTLPKYNLTGTRFVTKENLPAVNQ